MLFIRAILERGTPTIRGQFQHSVETRMTKTRMKLIAQICGYMVSVKVRLKLSAIYYADMVVKELTNNKQVVQLIILILLNQTVVNVEVTG